MPALVILIVLLGLFPQSVAAPSDGAGDQDAADWVGEHWWVVRDVVLPAPAEPGALPNAIRWRLTARISPSLNPEAHFTLERHYDGNVVASLTALKAEPLVSQLDRLRANHPELGAEALSGHLRVEREVLTGSTCPQLRTLAASLESIEIPSVLPDRLVIHGTYYEVWSESQHGANWGVRYTTTSGPKKDVALIGWVETVHSVLRSACVSTTPTLR